ncbi:MAG TPA: hypothetical protein VJ183_07600 [Chloroflexia bacterium]|nr:hypothetical protein [Chloroflexia bacterium]
MPSATGIKVEGVWQEGDCARWRGWLDSYDAILAAQGNEKLANLDRWFREELPTKVAERASPCIYADELQGIAAWKMHRGVWRERNRLLVAGNPPEKVEEVSREAYAAVPDPRKPVALISTLAGVGPATASAALAAYAPHIYPFFDELVAAFIPGLGPVAFTLPYYLKYASALRERADLLNSTCSDRTWTAHDVAQALWALGSSH